ncbi:hypothetical protein TVAG_204760 [Trichomonas vaginalis G3]|uniref:Chorein N-terminal domain-containing protein n=1 Tax=Trichomonas vaginalis (strain ATCC PRA-98 / G3) TaxID=412133 RepID=A2EIY0_TRIV3|nr:regulation of parkin-mediated stimulation of mitophagy in response to mitochondrial depolarization [Trichomonas vaginalis G3]EAY07370.1 hypothetical protein TVAG_204760 [Trichomonas vaginalis G3]KAI5506523.1 regulation of parkin-mediated stimulation of mitophagy in response to mitochondrial depolarization [Trichomonas vaginalis G3]|eukprot:XP_001319593.1 hypothetical protein [Trichomonas vaginalis G3]
MKNIVSHVITGYLETLIQPLKNNQLNIDIWNGKLKMENLVFREDGLFNLGFPLKIIHGTATEIKADFSWNKLETEPVIASIKDVFLLTELDWQNFEQRQPILKSDKLNIKSAESEKEKIQTIQAFLDFTNKIIGTIQMNVENIHVIMQIPLVDQKVFVGFTMNSLKIENNEKSTLKNILKDIKFNAISIYMDPTPHVFDLEKFQEEMKDQLNMNNHEIIFELPLFETSFFRSKEKNVTHNNIFDIKFNEIDFGLTIPQLRSIIQVSRAFQQHIKRRTYRLLMPPSDSEDFGKQFGHITKFASYNNSRMKFNVGQALEFLKNRSKYYKLYSEDMIKGKISKQFSKFSEKVNDETRVLLYNYSLAKYKLDNKNYDYKLKDDESMNFMGNYASILDSFNVIEFHFAAKRVVTYLKDADKIIRFSTIAESVKTNLIYTKQLQKVSFSIGAFSLFHENLNFISGIGRGSSKFLTAASDFVLNMIKANADFGIIEIRHVEPFIEQFMPFITGMSGAIPKTKIKFRTLA